MLYFITTVTNESEDQCYIVTVYTIPVQSKSRNTQYYVIDSSPPPPIFQTNQIFNPPISGH